MGTSNLTFARTLETVDEPIVDPHARFPNFKTLVPEIRIAIWQSILPAAEDETPAIFAQRPMGHLDMPHGLVPIRMTTTCAALLHVNQESRRITLSWAETLGYKLCYRALCFDPEYWAECDAMSDRKNYTVTRRDKQVRDNLPVQGPIFVRPWNADKDILNMTYTSHLYGVPESWDKYYRDGEQMPHIQHLAFNLWDVGSCLGSAWFYQLIGVMPNLKSISLDYDRLEDPRIAEFFEEQYIETKDVGVGVVGAASPGSGIEQDGSSTRNRGCRVRARWEPADCEPDEMRYSQHIEQFQWSMMAACIEDNRWSLNASYVHRTWEEREDHEEFLRRENLTNVPPWNRPGAEAKLQNVPPWIWNHEKRDFAVECRVFRMVERRGYDDVGGGHVVKCKDLYGDA